MHKTTYEWLRRVLPEFGTDEDGRRAAMTPCLPVEGTRLKSLSLCIVTAESKDSDVVPGSFSFALYRRGHGFLATDGALNCPEYRSQ